MNQNRNEPIRDLRYWLDVWLGFVALVLLCVGIGHSLDWLKRWRLIDGEITLACLSGYGLIFLLHPQRFNIVIISLLSIVVLGTINSLILQSLAGLPVILPCALLAYLLLRWKGNLLK
jgi:hypothetical protein